MHRNLKDWIAKVLEAHSDVLAIALRQRAKFEGWLKLELAATAAQHGCVSVELETPLPSNKGERADIGFSLNGEKFYVELKTPNSNWRFAGIENRTRPITKNISSIIEDVEKLRKVRNALIAFTLFPIKPGDVRWREYVRRISEETRIIITEKEHCHIVDIPVTQMQRASIMICCFSVTN
ncbi:MAG: hypothetical protein ACYC7L_08445 [Nitrospirota bacterium]